jgi:hypothetical protein
VALAIQHALVPTAVVAILGYAAISERRHMAMTAMFVWRDLGVVIGLIGSMVVGALAERLGRDPTLITFYGFAAVFLVCSGLSLLLARRAEERL